MRRRWMMTMAQGVSWQDVAVPDPAFSFVPFTIQQQGRTFRAGGGWDVSTLAPTGKAYYVKTTGSDSASGLDWDNAYATVPKALQQTDLDVMYIGAGYWGGRFDNSPSRNISVIGVGSVYYTSDRLITAWTAVDSHYEKTVGYCGMVADGSNLDSYGDYQLYAKQTSVAAVDSTPGSFYHDFTKLYVRTFDSRAPDTNVHCYSNSGPINIVRDNHVIYFENINFEGGSKGVIIKSASATGGAKGYFKNCTFKYGAFDGSSYDNAIAILGADAIFQGCSGAKSGLDIFNYDVANTIIPTGIEINCSGHNIGNVAALAANGSSSHNGAKVVRIMDNFTRTYGPVYNDVGAAKNWNLGCIASTSLYSGAAQYCFNFGSGDSSCDQWLDSCTSLTPTSNDIYGAGAGKIKIRNFVGTGSYQGTPASY